MSEHNVFAGAFVDRSGHRRKDADWLHEAMEGTDARFVPVWDQKCMARGEPSQVALFERAEVAGLLTDRDVIFLGLFEDRPVFAVGIEGGDQPPLGEAADWHDLRALGSVLPINEANLVAHARALVIWHDLQRHCGVCGSTTRVEAAGNTRVCNNEECGIQSFPRVDPAIIVLVERGEYCLLGRQPTWPEARYSTIAGFVEPGESLEDAVRREVFEETNIHVGEVRYHSSQPWPFPSSLMLGFFARATSDDIRLNDGELEDAQWFTREDLRSGFPKLPFRLSIARRLVETWLDDSG